MDRVGSVRRWRRAPIGSVVRVHDHGPGPADPLTGLAPAPGGSAGAGFGLWLIHQFTNIDIVCGSIGGVPLG